MLISLCTPKQQAYGLRTHTLAAMTSWTQPTAGLSSSDHDSHTAHQGMGAEHTGDIDPVEAYFECITNCSLDDQECVTVCTTVLRDHS